MREVNNDLSKKDLLQDWIFPPLFILIEEETIIITMVGQSLLTVVVFLF